MDRRVQRLRRVDQMITRVRRQRPRNNHGDARLLSNRPSGQRAVYRIVDAGETRSDSVRVDLPQPLVADAKVVRYLVLDDVAHTF